MRTRKPLEILPMLIGTFALALLAGCVVSKSVVSEGVDLSKYKYVAVVDNDTYRKELSLNARQVVSTYSEDTVMAKWVKLFNSLVEK